MSEERTGNTHRDHFFSEKVFPDKREPMPLMDRLSVNTCEEARELIDRDVISSSDWLRLGPHLEHCDACRARGVEVAKRDWGSGTA